MWSLPICSTTKATPGDSKTTYIQFVGDEDDHFAFGDLTGGYVYLDCSLNEEAVGDKESIVIQIGDKEYKIYIEDNAKSNPALGKTGSFSDTENRFDWTVTYTYSDGDKVFSGPITFTDSFTGGHTYVPVLFHWTTLRSMMRT